MGTSNFYNKNASKVFAVGMNEEIKYSKCSECGNKLTERDEEYDPEAKDCVDCEEKDCITHGTEDRPLEDYEWSDLDNWIKETISKSPNYMEGGEDDRDRNFYGSSLGYLSKDKNFGDINVEVRVQGMIRSAYYEGANLDYQDVEILVDGYVNDLDSVKEAIVEYATSTMNTGLKTIQGRNAAKWASKVADELVEELEKIYTEISMPLKTVARFSNGETIYAKA